MVRVGARELPVPVWLWAGLPIAAVLYCIYQFSVLFSVTPRGALYHHADRDFLSMMTQFGTASLTAFLLADLARRARTPWYALPFLYLVSAAAAVFIVTDTISRPLDGVARFLVGAAIGLAASTGAAGGAGVFLIALPVVVTALMAIGAALCVTLASRFLVGLPLRSRDTLREFWANLGGAIVWFAFALGGYLALRSPYDLAWGTWTKAMPWLPYAAAGCAGVIATALHLLLARRSRERENAGPGHLRIWLLAALAVGSIVYRPDLLGSAGVRAYYDHIKPALRAVHLLPTPAIAIAGYTVDVPYHDLKVAQRQPHPSGGSSYVRVPLPAEFGLAAGKWSPRVEIYRRDAYDWFWQQRRTALESVEKQKPGEDALVHFSTGTPAVMLRTGAFPELDFQLSNFDSATPPAVAEAALRRFLSERLHRGG